MLDNFVISNPFCLIFSDQMYCIVLIVLTSGVQLRTKCLVSLCTRRYFIGDENGTRGHASVCGGAEL